MEGEHEAERGNEQMNADIRDWLLGLPEGAVIGWSDNALGEGFRHMLGGWADVQVPMALSEIGLNWLWTVDLVESAAGHEDQGADALVASEGDALIVDTPGGERLEALACYHDGTEYPLTEAEIDYLASPDLEPYEIGGYRVYLSPLARLATVNHALEGLAVAVAGRYDLRFRFEPEIDDSPMFKVAQERWEDAKEAIESGDTGRFVTMQLDDPDWMADFLDISREEAEAHIAESSKAAEAIGAQIDCLIAQRKERAQKLLVRHGLLPNA
jgi:hypothetical protein